jgi:glutathione S-transferase
MSHQHHGPAFRLYGAERSYFTGKVRPALRAKRVYFEEVVPGRTEYQEIRERTGLMFIPVVITPEDETWQDTSDILDALEARFPEPALVPATPVQRIVSSLLELHGDEFMILPAMHYRWTRTEWSNDARGAFAAGSGNRQASDAFADRMAGSLPMIGVSDRTIPAIEAHLAELLEHMQALFADQRFFLGEQMSLGDCGMLGPFYAHLYLDLAPGQIVRQHPLAAQWIEHMNHPDPTSFAGFLPDDALHPALRGVLELIGQDAVPILLDSMRAFESWADSADVETPPRAVGMHETSLRGIRYERMTSAYTPYMVQRPIDAYRALSDDERKRVDQALAGTGCEALLQHEPRHRVAKREFQLVLER